VANLSTLVIVLSEYTLYVFFFVQEEDGIRDRDG